MQGSTDMSEDGAGMVGPPEIRSSRKMLCPWAGGTEGGGGVPLNPGPESPVEAGAEQEGENTLASLLPPPSLILVPPTGWTPTEASRKGSLGMQPPGPGQLVSGLGRI